MSLDVALHEAELVIKRQTSSYVAAALVMAPALKELASQLASERHRALVLEAALRRLDRAASSDADGTSTEAR